LTIEFHIIQKKIINIGKEVFYIVRFCTTVLSCALNKIIIVTENELRKKRTKWHRWNDAGDKRQRIDNEAIGSLKKERFEDSNEERLCHRTVTHRLDNAKTIRFSKSPIDPERIEVEFNIKDNKNSWTKKGTKSEDQKPASFFRTVS
jgi:hypothetical protein